MWLIVIVFWVGRRELCLCSKCFAFGYTQVWTTTIDFFSSKHTKFISQLPLRSRKDWPQPNWPAVLPPECWVAIVSHLLRGLLLGGLCQCVTSLAYGVEGPHLSHYRGLFLVLCASCPGEWGICYVLGNALGLSPQCCCFWNAFFKDWKKRRQFVTLTRSRVL